MKRTLLSHRLGQLLQQRNAVLALATGLLVINGLLVVMMCCTTERIVVVPPQVTRTFWVEQNQVSAAYLEEMGLFWTTFMLEISPESAAYKRDMIGSFYTNLHSSDISSVATLRS